MRTVDGISRLLLKNGKERINHRRVESREEKEKGPDDRHAGVAV